MQFRVNSKALILGVLIIFCVNTSYGQVDYHLGYGPLFFYDKYDHVSGDVNYPEYADSIQGSARGLGLSYSVEGFYQIGERSFIGGGVFPTVGFSGGPNDEGGLFVDLPINFEYLVGEDEYDNFFAAFGLNTLWRDSYIFPGQIGLDVAIGTNLFLGNGSFKARLSYTRGLVSFREILHSEYNDIQFKSNLFTLGLYYMY